MTESNIEKELNAIKIITSALETLEKAVQQRVLQYSMQHLGLQLTQAESPPSVSDDKSNQTGDITSSQEKLSDIRSLRDQKQPNSDMEMAAIVAYYLSELAPKEIQKDTIETEDIKTYFKQAGHPLPTGPQFTLPNAKAAGYVESAGYGKYKLNPVGHNLVAHGLPRTKDSTPTSPRKKRKAKKIVKKKTGLK
ncbi:MAG: hypothetical protein PHF37_10775 [Phycisphaerae bacterium]|nr:hypothetical protein [Phycisphaerae bacterium]